MALAVFTVLLVLVSLPVIAVAAVRVAGEISMQQKQLHQFAEEQLRIRAEAADARRDLREISHQVISDMIAASER